MSRLPPIRGSRAGGAVLVVGLHVAFVWLVTRTAPAQFPEFPNTEPALAVVQLPAMRMVDEGPVPIPVELADVPRLQLSAPSIRDVVTEELDAPVTPNSVRPMESLPDAQAASAGLNGEFEDSAGLSGGGKGRVLLTRVPPQYPLSAKRLREEGKTQALLRVDEAGKVLEVKVIASSGSRRLDNAAVSAFRKWKFASVPSGTAPEGTWIETSHRFLLTHINYSLLQDTAAGSIQVTDGGARGAPPGSAPALRRFLETVVEGRLNEFPDRAREQLAPMRAALSQWGSVKSVEFVSTAGPPEWTAYQVAKDAAPHAGVSRVDCKWAVLEVRLENAKTVWLVALDRDGMIWSARVGPAI